MGRLDYTTDLTGGMSPLQLNETNIRTVIDELNRNSDQLDAIANALNIVGRGSLSATWNGSAGSIINLSQAHGFGTAPIFLATYNRSDEPGVYHMLPYWAYDTSGNYQSVTFAYTDSTNINFGFVSNINGSAVTFKFSWYILQQPAQVPTGS